MRNIRRTHIFFLGALLTTYAIASWAEKPLNTSESGIEGQVSIGPMCPVARPDQPAPTSLSPHPLRFKIKMIKGAN